jgi:hypothetical protein
LSRGHRPEFARKRSLNSCLKQESAAGRDPAPQRKFARMTDVNLPSSDGFDTSSENNRLIQGEIIRFADGRWSTKEGAAFSGDLALLAVGTARALQRWEARMLVETIVERPGERLPDLEELNEAIPKEQWEAGLDGKPRPPWVMQSVVYLLNPRDAATFTYLNSTVGARIAVERLAEKVGRMRMLRGSRVLPLVTLDSKPMKTKFGTKLRPEFTVVDWRDFGSPSIAPSELKALGKPAAPVSPAEELNDAINF